MQLLIGIICVFVFLYSLYILGKDDYVLIRKNLSLEQLFDFAFIGIFTGIIFARILSIIFHPVNGENFVSQLFSLNGAGFTLTGVVFGCMLAFYLIGKYRKLPIGHLFDFLTLALLSCFPIVYLISIFFVKRNEIVYYFVLGIFYLACQRFFWKFLLPRIISNKLKEGSLSGFFFLVFSVASFLASLIYRFSGSPFRFEAEDFLLVGVILGSIVFLLRNERRILRGKR